MNTIVIIPARYASTRFPGKPLALLGGIPIIVRVANRVKEAGYPVYVATDDYRIADTCESHNISFVMTNKEHKSGTDRIHEAFSTLSKKGISADVIINVQGDEPFVCIDQIIQLEKLFDYPDTQIGTLCQKFPKDGIFEELLNPNLVKVVINDNNEAMYFSRSIIPFFRGEEKNEWPSHHQYLTHIGIYAYRPEILDKITALNTGDLEKSESLEQLRWLEAGFRIKIGMTESRNIGIDTPDDLKNAEKMLHLIDGMVDN